MILNLVLLLIWIVCIAFLWNEGLWSIMLSFLNTILAAIVATNYFEPVANLLEKQQATFTYFWDFLALWFLFAITYGLMRAVTDSLSRVRVRFKMPVEQTGRVLLSVLTGWVFVSFVTMTLHTAPLSRSSFRGSFQPTPSDQNFFGLGPDLAWLGFFQNASRGGYSQPDATAQATDPADRGLRVFDPQGEFVLKYGTRRQHLSEEPSMRVRR
jgi:hypothetical protein